MSDEKPVRDQDKFMLRLPDGLRDRIAHAAKFNKRSMNAEIVAILEEALPKYHYEELSFIDEIDEIAAKLAKLRESRIAEASQNWSQEFIEEVEEKLKPKPLLKGKRAVKKADT